MYSRVTNKRSVPSISLTNLSIGYTLTYLEGMRLSMLTKSSFRNIFIKEVTGNKIPYIKWVEYPFMIGIRLFEGATLIVSAKF